MVESNEILNYWQYLIHLHSNICLNACMNMCVRECVWLCVWGIVYEYVCVYKCVWWCLTDKVGRGGAVRGLCVHSCVRMYEVTHICPCKNKMRTSDQWRRWREGWGWRKSKSVSKSWRRGARTRIGGKNALLYPQLHADIRLSGTREQGNKHKAHRRTDGRTG